MDNSRPIINPGLRIGLLTVGDLVRNVQSHPLFPEIKVSYLRQGRLRECICDCGKEVLYSEAALACGRVKSCGCLRQARWDRKAQDASQLNTVKKDILEIRGEIQSAKLGLSKWKLQPITYRDSLEGRKECTELADRVRQLYGRLGNATKKLKDLKDEQSKQKHTASLDSSGD